MRQLHLVLTTFLALSAPARAQEPAPPPIVIDGLKVLISAGVDTAVAVWFKGSSLEGDTAAVGQVTATFHNLPAWLGKPTGYELLKTYALGTRLRRTYAILLLEGGPMYFRFTYYLGSKGWIMQHLDFNTDAEKILPASLLPP
jgi:hypothetical protein